MKNILQNYRRIAVVGLSPKPARPSNMVAAYLIGVGYTVIPVNPGHDEILGCRCYPDLESLSEPVDIVDIFRRSEDVLPVVASAISIGAKVIWLQSGIVNKEAARLAEKAGLRVVMDYCIKVAHANLFKGEAAQGHGGHGMPCPYAGKKF